MQETPSVKSRAPKELFPLLGAIAACFIFTLLLQWWHGSIDLMKGMRDFMGSLLVLFGVIKLLNLQGFVAIYRSYDIIAKKSALYAYAYPFIEIALGVLYLINLFPVPVNILTALLALINSASVFRALGEKRDISCACMGTTFRTPLTKLTLFENIFTCLMALSMLIMHLLAIKSLP